MILCLTSCALCMSSGVSCTCLQMSVLSYPHHSECSATSIKWHEVINPSHVNFEKLCLKSRAFLLWVCFVFQRKSEIKCRHTSTLFHAKQEYLWPFKCCRMFDKVIETVSRNYALSIISYNVIKSLKIGGLKIEKIKNFMSDNSKWKREFSKTEFIFEFAEKSFTIFLSCTLD